MELIVSQPAAIQMRTLPEEDRRRVASWFDSLRNWENDPFVRGKAHRLSTDEDVYVLRTSGDIRVFFRFEGQRIVILDIAPRAALQSFNAPGE